MPFAKLMKRYDERGKVGQSLEDQGLVVVHPNDVYLNGAIAKFGLDTIRLGDVVDVVINEDTDHSDEIGGSAVIRTRSFSGPGDVSYVVHRVTFAKDAFAKATKFAEQLKARDIPVEITNILDSSFRRAFFYR